MSPFPCTRTCRVPPTTEGLGEPREVSTPPITAELTSWAPGPPLNAVPGICRAQEDCPFYRHSLTPVDAHGTPPATRTQRTDPLPPPYTLIHECTHCGAAMGNRGGHDVAYRLCMPSCIPLLPRILPSYHSAAFPVCKLQQGFVTPIVPPICPCISE